MRFIACQPLGNLGAWGLQKRRQLAAATPLRVQHYCLQSLGHAIGSVPFRILAQANQPLISARVQTNHSRKHGTPPNESMPSFSGYVPLIMRSCIAVPQFAGRWTISSLEPSNQPSRSVRPFCVLAVTLQRNPHTVSRIVRRRVARSTDAWTPKSGNRMHCPFLVRHKGGSRESSLVCYARSPQRFSISSARRRDTILHRYATDRKGTPNTSWQWTEGRPYMEPLGSSSTLRSPYCSTVAIGCKPSACGTQRLDLAALLDGFNQGLLEGFHVPALINDNSQRSEIERYVFHGLCNENSPLSDCVR
jgi:hypothetical protein